MSRESNIILHAFIGKPTENLKFRTSSVLLPNQKQTPDLVNKKKKVRRIIDVVFGVLSPIVSKTFTAVMVPFYSKRSINKYLSLPVVCNVKFQVVFNSYTTEERDIVNYGPDAF